MAQAEKGTRIGILAYPGAQASAVHGLADLFETANRLAAERGGKAARLEVSRWGESGAAEEPPAPLAALVLPPSLSGRLPDAEERALADWTRRRHGEGTLLCSVCAGAFLLAETGLLDGRPATTHWALAERFAERFPRVRLEIDKLVVDDGDIMTAGGLMAWVDLGLRLVERLIGPSVMLATARFFLVDPAGREQRFYSAFAPRLTHGDAAVLKAQHWLQARSGEKITLTRMAEVAGLGQRTFQRRFAAATGLKPSAYLQHLRVGKARDLLELSAETIDRIAWQVGYEDPGAFRKVFQKVMGLTAGDYRRRFHVDAVDKRGAER